jgi:hypothetical protein
VAEAQQRVPESPPVRRDDLPRRGIDEPDVTGDGADLPVDAGELVDRLELILCIRFGRNLRTKLNKGQLQVCKYFLRILVLYL